jgi:ribonuclease P protein component
VVLIAPGVPGNGARLGLTVSRKVGNSVVRNLVKRRIRAWFRVARARFPDAWDIVVIARRQAAHLEYERSAQMLSHLVAEGSSR